MGQRVGNSPELDWSDGVPVARAFDDPYFSLQNGMAETEHVFLAGNDLPARFVEGFHIAELGFGTGLNALLAWQASRVRMRTLRFTSFEAFPLKHSLAAQALAAFPQIADLADALLESWPETTGRVTLPGLELTLIVGDARETLPQWGEQADAWFLDGFSPAKNPELWNPALLSAVGDHTVPQGTFATYTAAGHVRRGLEAAGFEVTRTPGYGRKRHMSRGVKR